MLTNTTRFSQFCYCDVTSNATRSNVNPVSIEYFHAMNHIMIGGSFNDFSTASFDPLFFMYHAFFDFLFDRVRRKLVWFTRKLIPINDNSEIILQLMPF